MTTTQTFMFMCLAAAVAAAAISGCGSSDATAEAPPTKKQYIRKADAICEKQGGEQFKGAIRYLKAHPGAEEEDLVEPVLLPFLEKQLQELQELTPPTEGEADLTAYFHAFASALKAVNEDPQSAIASQGNSFERTRKLGEKYGFADCHVLP